MEENKCCLCEEPLLPEDGYEEDDNYCQGCEDDFGHRVWEDRQINGR